MRRCRRNGFTMQYDPERRVCDTQLQCSTVAIGSMDERYREFFNEFVLDPVTVVEKPEGSSSNDESYINRICFG